MDERDEDAWAVFDRLDAMRGWTMYYGRDGTPMAMRDWVVIFYAGKDEMAMLRKLAGEA